MEKGEGIENWSERVEDLLHEAEVDSAISLLESVIETLNPSSDRVSQLQLASALSDLANLYSSKGLSVKSQDLQSRAFLIKQLHHSNSADARVVKESKEDEIVNGKKLEELLSHSSSGNAPSDDDWEAKVDCEPDELLSAVSSNCLSGISNLKLEDTKSQTPKRRGRGKFCYDKDKLYSDMVLEGSTTDVEEEESHRGSKDKRDIQNLKYGTSHVLVLADFSPTTTTTDLEKLFENFKNSGFVIRWVNDTVALAVFRTPANALEALNNIRPSYTVRILDEDDVLLSSITASDLEPPLQRPKTSTEAALRLIAHGMGVNPSSLSSGSPGGGSRNGGSPGGRSRSGGSPQEHKRLEYVRRERIVTRQKLKDDAWGEDS